MIWKNCTNYGTLIRKLEKNGMSETYLFIAWQVDDSRIRTPRQSDVDKNFQIFLLTKKYKLFT